MTLIDFEAVALGSGAQDLGQFVISHMAPDVRRGCEKQLIEAYHKELVAALKARGLDEAADACVFCAFANFVARDEAAQLSACLLTQLLPLVATLLTKLGLSTSPVESVAGHFSFHF